MNELLPLEKLLRYYRDTATSTRDKGDKFERLTKFFLQNDKRFSDRFSDVWMWKDFPLNEGKVDTGIDVVAKEKYGDGYCAVQCKFFGEHVIIDKGDIDSFFTASGKHIYTSRLIFSTTALWTTHAEDALLNQKIPVQRITTEYMEAGSIDWDNFNRNLITAPQRRKNAIREHQEKALADVLSGFEKNSRGKLIMACGTGKTFTSLKIAEKIGGRILFLAPSISLVSQTFNEWIVQSDSTIHGLIVCSDKTIKGDEEDMPRYELLAPPTTDAKVVAIQGNSPLSDNRLNVVFSTYQSIEVVIDAQQKYGLPEFDLVICDEAHRTTGLTLSDRDDSHFTKVHDEIALKSKRRLYMTATPRIYAESSKSKASKAEATLYSMDDETQFGTEFHRLGFGAAVEKGLLSDYKVMVLGVHETYASKFVQQYNELSLDDDIPKIIGCWNGLSKKLVDGAEEGNPMRRAVAFTSSIEKSKVFARRFEETVKDFIKSSEQGGDLLRCEIKHVDGTMNASLRNSELKWLKEDTAELGNLCRILVNVRCLSEGVDVPSLDAVLFLNPRNSMVDVVQSVGRAMRRAEGKKYGYIIIPISIPANVEPEIALNDNKRYKVVWDVCQALRAHDDRFEATVNKIELNVNKPDTIEYVDIGGGSEDGTASEDNDEVTEGAATLPAPSQSVQLQLELTTAEKWQNAILGKIAKKCGQRDYWENWAKGVSEIAEKHIDNIRTLLNAKDSDYRESFDDYVKGLQTNINPSVTEDDAIEMLAQHLITKPIFDALFEGYEFAKHNPVSVAIQSVLDKLHEHMLVDEQKTLESFYESVRRKIEGIDNAAAKQAIIKELYDKFFNQAFRKMAERLGIVYTPIEVVDFIIHSVDYVLRKEFGKSFSDKSVHVLDPFTGTGTFIVRLLQSGLIGDEAMEYMYKNNLHANEIVLLAYYIAAVNIEETYHFLNKDKDYRAFDGIVLTDTFQLAEKHSERRLEFFRENNARVQRQEAAAINVIIGNPPYSAQQGSENDGNKNLAYEGLDGRIRDSYAHYSNATLQKNLYDSYVRGIRWASDRLDKDGVVAFVTNGSFIEANNMDGLRKCLRDEFTDLYIYNLRGNQRTQGDTSRKEGGKIFGSGSRTPVAISILLKNSAKPTPGTIHYSDIGDYLSREEKLSKISQQQLIENVSWTTLEPNEKNDWVNVRGEDYDNLLLLGDKSGGAEKVFSMYSLGVVTARDAWIYSYSKSTLIDNVKRLLTTYNEHVERLRLIVESGNDSQGLFQNATERETYVEGFVDNDATKISWTRALKQSLGRLKTIEFDEDCIRRAAYRPFTKQVMYFSRELNEMVYKMPALFPSADSNNQVICIAGIGSNAKPSALVSNHVVDLEMVSKAQCYPLCVYESSSTKPSLFDMGVLTQHSAITETTLHRFRAAYDDAAITPEHIFHYVYAIYHCKDFIEKYKSDLMKASARVAFVSDFWGYSVAGAKLAALHIGYEAVEPYKLQVNSSSTANKATLYHVEKMRFGKSTNGADKSTIVYNNYITVSGIPLEAYDYVVNGKSAIAWIMERYQISTHKDSGIVNNPNDWCVEVGDEKYILNLLLRIVTVSMETLKIVNALPAYEEL